MPLRGQLLTTGVESYETGLVTLSGKFSLNHSCLPPRKFILPQDEAVARGRTLQVGPRRLDTPRLGVEIRLSRAVLASLPSAKRARGGNLGRGASGASGGSAFAERVEEGYDGFGGEILVVVVVDLDHRSVDAGAKTLDFEEGEEAVGSGLAFSDAKVFLDSLDNNIASAATELAWCLQYNTTTVSHPFYTVAESMTQQREASNSEGQELKQTVVHA